MIRGLTLDRAHRRGTWLVHVWIGPLDKGPFLALSRGRPRRYVLVPMRGAGRVFWAGRVFYGRKEAMEALKRETLKEMLS